MKGWKLSFLLLFTTAVRAGQADPILRLEKLPEDGLVLSRFWTFHQNDDPENKFFEYRGKQGTPVNPALVLGQLPLVKGSGFGWFRLKMQVDSALRNKTVGMTVSLFGAAEIYLNGNLLYRFGTVSHQYEQEKTQAIYSRTLSLTFGNTEKQLIAVRYSNHPDNMDIKTGVVPFCLRLELRPLNKAIDHYAILTKRVYRFLAIALTVELTSAVLTLFFFFSFRSRREYLYFGIYFACNFLAMLVQGTLVGVSKEEYMTVNEMAIIQYVIYLFLITGSIYHLKAMYALLQLRPTRFYRFLFWYAIISMALVMVLPEWGSILPAFFFPLACIEILPTYYKAARRGFKGGWILFGSIFICFAFLLWLIKANYELDMEFISVLTALALMTPALGIMIFLAVDFARTSSALQIRIVEVESLSQKNLAQEKEKQEILALQKEKLEREVEKRTAALRQSLADLKATQAQLIHAEKMASLGELTAGIAHEIQNPLNFVTNFSEVGIELSKEVKEELENSLLPDAQKLVLLRSAEELERNQEKVLEHSQRAGSIVKNMLQHSRRSEGKKESTDINALVDQYLRLSYHGQRAKNKDFTSAMEIHFDDSVGNINVVQEEMGRVLLNLFNNAFYSLAEKKKQFNGHFEPALTVRTRKEKDQVQIIISDNGTGMSRKVSEKVFQPFFTTKPAGEGTGLGLSLSYEIITKGHGGALTVRSRDGEGAEFIIQLPAGD